MGEIKIIKKRPTDYTFINDLPVTPDNAVKSEGKKKKKKKKKSASLIQESTGG